uniref:LIM zinc-binding domain-containing protein n=1 Tax=Oryzias latipes TaxID=8090 RepID=A0A3B3H276_ORYLA
MDRRKWVQLSTTPCTQGDQFSGAQDKNLSLRTKEMCSAGLTPIYPMEKMVASKLMLHHNFSCKYCKKKLSIHNDSSLHGEFYCVSHYQQLFKRKGNYDEAFGHTPHKDRWFNKNKAADEPDAHPSEPDPSSLTVSHLSTLPRLPRAILLNLISRDLLRPIFLHKII